MRTTRKLLSLFLALVMVIGLFPVSAFADGTITTAEDGAGTITDADAPETEDPAVIPGEAEAEQKVFSVEETESKPEPVAEIKTEAVPVPAAATEQETAAEPEEDDAIDVPQVLESHTFTTQPEIEAGEDGVLILRWEMDFTPLRVWLYRCAMNEDWPEEPEEPFYKLVDEEMAERRLEIAPDAENRYRLAAWYGEAGDACVLSQDFTVSAHAVLPDETEAQAQEPAAEKGTRDTYAFTEQPEYGETFYYDPDKLYCTINWKTNFVPKLIEIVLSTNGASEVVQPITTGLAKEMSYPFSVTYGNQFYRIRAYYDITEGNERFVTCDGFWLSTNLLGFTEGPEYAETYYYDPDTLSYTMPWKTNFVPKRIEIVLSTNGASEVVKTITTGLAKEMSYPFPVTYGNQFYRIRAYYSTGSGAVDENYVQCSGFWLSTNLLGFTEGPEYAETYYYDPDTLSYTMPWKTNFVPKRIEIVLSTNGASEVVKTITTGLAKEMSYPFPVSYGNQFYRIRAYYSTGTGAVDENYVQCSGFWLSANLLGFTEGPEYAETYYYDPDTLSYTMPWKTNFMPKRIEIVRATNGDSTVVKTITTGLAKEMSYPFPVTYGNDFYQIRAYYSTGSSAVDERYVQCSGFWLSANRLSFTEGPEYANTYYYDPNTLSYTMPWKTNFVPKRIEIVRATDGASTVVKTITTGLAKEMSYPFPASYGNEFYQIRAYYSTGTGAVDENYVQCSGFWLSANLLWFLTDPAGWTLPQNNEVTVEWSTNFVPIKAEILYYPSANSDNPVSVVTITSGLSKNMSFSFSFDDPSVSRWWFVKAYYASSRACWSDTFVINEIAPAGSGNCSAGDYDAVTWSYANGTLTISGSGAMADFTVNSVPWKYYRQQIQNVVIGEAVTNVGTYAFRNCQNLASVSLPATLSRIGDYAFQDCPALANANVNMTEADFAAVTWDKSLNTGLKAAAKHFSAVASGKAGSFLTWTVQNDGFLVFSGSGAMYNWSNKEEVPWYPYRSRITNISLTNVSGVGSYAFSGLERITSISIPNTVNSVGEGAFLDCIALETVNFANGCTLTTIGSSTFRGCTTLRTIALPNSIAAINQYAFYNCTALTTVTAYSGTQLTTVGPYAFYGCRKLASFTMASTITAIGDHAFYNCVSLPAINLPAGLTTLGSYSFYGCTGATGTITIPSGITAIPAGCFQNCSGFYQLDFSTQVTAIQGNAFAGCTNLTTVNYNGFKSQYQRISIDLTNTPLRSATIYYLYIYSTIPNTDISYTIYGATGKLVISGTGSMAAWANAQSAPWYQYAPYFQIIDVHEGVNQIGAYAFCGTTALTTLYLPESLTLIGTAAFRNSSALTDVWYNSSLVVRQEKLTIETLNTCLDTALWHYVDIGGTVYGPDGGTDLSWSLNDAGVLRIYWDEDSMDQNYMAIPDYSDECETPWYLYGDRNGQIIPMIKAVHVDELVTRVGDCTFAGLTELTEIQIASSATSIGDKVFQGCSKLENVVLPDTVETLGYSIFWLCGSLETAALPAGITEIPYGTFFGCEELHTVHVPGTVESIEQNAFSGCSNMYSGDVYFDGTSAQWSAIDLYSGNDAINSAAIHFNPPEIKVDEINFPDANFRAWVAANTDTDNSGWLTDEERLAVNIINCQNKGIISLSGIEFFPRLEAIDCSGNAVTSLNLSDNQRLINLVCNDNALTELDISGNPTLTYVACMNCGLTALDVSTNIELDTLICDGNALTVLKLSNNPKLAYLSCVANQLTELDLSANTSLTTVYCENNLLTVLTLDRQENLSRLSCYGNRIRFLDLLESPVLKNAVISGTRNVYSDFVEYRLDDSYVRADASTVLVAAAGGIPIDAEHFPDDAFRNYVAAELDPNGDGWLTLAEQQAVEEIECVNMGIASLAGIEYFPNLDSLTCSENTLTALNLSGNPLITWLDCGFNEELTALDLSSLPALDVLYCSGCLSLTALDLSHNPVLTELDCRECALNVLNLSANSLLWYLDCSCNILTELELNDLPALRSLMCNDNSLEALNIGDNPELYYIDCFGNALSVLDLSHNPSLTYTDCSGNGLTALTLGELPLLRELYCHENSLTRLDLTDVPLVLDAVRTTEGDLNDGTVIYSKGEVQFYVDPGVALIPVKTFSMTGSELSSTGVSYSESLSRYVLNGKVHTPIWQDGFAPDFTALSSLSATGITVDEANTQLLQTEPEVGGVYYVRFSISTNAAGQGVVDFSGLSTANCTLTVPGYDASCTRVMEYVTSGGFDAAVLVFKLYKLLPIDEEYFPDAVFRSYVAENFDSDGDGYLTDAECSAVNVIFCGNKGIASLEGIKYFSNLDYLECQGNDLTEMDFSNNLKLSYLCFCGNPITELDLSLNTALNMIECGNTPALTSLTLTGLINLSYLDAQSCGLTALDVSDCSLDYLECEFNPLRSLILGEQPSLSYLECYGTGGDGTGEVLPVLDISACPILVDAAVNGKMSEPDWGVLYESGPLGGTLFVDAGTKVLTGWLQLTFRHNCEFAANIAMHYLVPKADVEGYDSIALEIEMEKYAEDADEPTIETRTITSWSDYTLSGEEYCHFVFPGIFAAEMGNRITARVSAVKDGETVYSQADEYSVKEYAYNRLEKTTSATYRTLLVDMLNYGSAAQTHFGKNAANLVNADLTATQASWGTQGELVTNNNESTVPLEGATAEINGKNLMFGSSVYLLYRMAFAEGQDMSKVKIVFTYTNLKGEVLQQTVKASKFGTSGNYYTADCTNIIPSAMRCIVSATIYDGNTPISDTLNYSIETYVHNRLSASGSATYKALITQMLRYGISAENHFG